MSRRKLGWVDKLEDGVRREVRVTFPGPGIIKWQFKRSDEERWDYDTPPSPEDWAFLEERVEAHYRRRRLPLKYVELVRTQAQKSRKP
ncbi:MAG: hypothetical protein EOM20_14445 [Spartobacteria bacterium]|nr:hypothetical protein [Spartobacteria bacterium]